MLEDQLNRDLKLSLLARDEVRTSTLRSLKSALTYAKVAKGGSGELSDDQVTAIFAREAKMRQESADAFDNVGAEDKAKRELAEKAIIESYLPEQLSDGALIKLVDNIIKEIGASGIRQMGQVISQSKEAAGTQADGARIARIVKERLDVK